MPLIHKFHLAVGLLIVVIANGNSSVSCDNVEDRSIKQYDTTLFPLQENSSPVRRLLEYIRLRLSDNQVGARTFHQIKRFQTALLPIMYKLGVISTIIMITLFLAMKGVFIGTVILILNIAFFAAKLGGIFDKGHHHGWAGTQSQKDVHLHIHNGNGKPQYVPYSAPVWEPSNQGWSSYGPHHHDSGRHLQGPENAHITSTGKSDMPEPFEIIYPSESKTINSVAPYNYIKHYRLKTET